MEEAKQYLGEAAVLVTYGEDLNAQLIGKAIRLKWIMVMSAGMDLMPFKEIQRRGILVTNSRGIHQIPMAEYVIAMLLQVNRQTKQLLASERKKHWDRSVKMEEISGKTMLLLGTGAIGKEVARLAKAFHMETIGLSRSGRQVKYFDTIHQMDKINTVLPEADFVIAVLPSTSETRYLLTEEHFQLMKDSAIFLNMGRGDLVRSETIIKAVEEKQIAHAVLDVFEEEPLPETHPLWETDNITITPHLSGLSPQYVSRALAIFTKNLDKYIANDVNYTNKVDLSRGY